MTSVWIVSVNSPDPTLKPYTYVIDVSKLSLRMKETLVRYNGASFQRTVAKKVKQLENLYWIEYLNGKRIFFSDGDGTVNEQQVEICRILNYSA